MRNLRLLSETHRPVWREDQQQQFPLTWLTTNPSGVVCGSSHDIYTCHEGCRDSQHRVIPSEHSHVIGTEFLVAENVLFMATADGTLLLSWDSETVSFVLLVNSYA